MRPVATVANAQYPQAARPQQGQAAFKIIQVIGLVGIDEGEVEVFCTPGCQQFIQCMQGRGDTQIDSRPDAGALSRAGGFEAGGGRR